MEWLAPQSPVLLPMQCLVQASSSRNRLSVTKPLRATENNLKMRMMAPPSKQLSSSSSDCALHHDRDSYFSPSLLDPHSPSSITKSVVVSLLGICDFVVHAINLKHPLVPRLSAFSILSNLYFFQFFLGSTRLITRRRAPPQKAWQSGMNPLTQRSSTPAQQNGAGSHNKTGSQKPFASQEMAVTDSNAHDRLLYLYGNAMVGVDLRGCAKIADQIVRVCLPQSQ